MIVAIGDTMTTLHSEYVHVRLHRIFTVVNSGYMPGDSHGLAETTALSTAAV
jgi:hypothetical protein